MEQDNNKGISIAIVDLCQNGLSSAYVIALELIYNKQTEPYINSISLRKAKTPWSLCIRVKVSNI